MVDFEKIKVQWSKVPVPYNRSPVRNIDAPYSHPTFYNIRPLSLKIRREPTGPVITPGKWLPITPWSPPITP